MSRCSRFPACSSVRWLSFLGCVSFSPGGGASGHWRRPLGMHGRDRQRERDEPPVVLQPEHGFQRRVSLPAGARAPQLHLPDLQHRHRRDRLPKLEGEVLRRHGTVVRPENGNDTVSEGIGYGMLIGVFMNDKAMFDTLWSVREVAPLERRTTA